MSPSRLQICVHVVSSPPRPSPAGPSPVPVGSGRDSASGKRIVFPPAPALGDLFFFFYFFLPLHLFCSPSLGRGCPEVGDTSGWAGSRSLRSLSTIRPLPHYSPQQSPPQRGPGKTQPQRRIGPCDPGAGGGEQGWAATHRQGRHKQNEEVQGHGHGHGRQQPGVQPGWHPQQ